MVPRRALIRLASLWSNTRFRDPALGVYAERAMLADVRRGVTAMAGLSVLLNLLALGLCLKLEHDRAYLYTYAVALVLALHVLVSARVTHRIRDLYALGITLLVVSGAALVLLAHWMGSVSGLLLASVVLLFMVMPIVPWGVKHCVGAMALVYAVFTTSMYGVAWRFPAEQLWTMQFLMLAAAVTTLTIVARNVQVRRDDIKARFRLERAHRKVQVVSLQDPLRARGIAAFSRRISHGSRPSLEVGRKTFTSRCSTSTTSRAPMIGMVTTTATRILQRFARTLKQLVGNEGFVIRLGGDEFAVLYSGNDYAEHMSSALAAFAVEVEHERAPVEAVTASVGVVCVAPTVDVPLDVVYRRADQALYAAKSQCASAQLRDGNRVVVGAREVGVKLLRQATSLITDFGRGRVGSDRFAHGTRRREPGTARDSCGAGYGSARVGLHPDGRGPTTTSCSRRNASECCSAKRSSRVVSRGAQWCRRCRAPRSEFIRSPTAPPASEPTAKKSWL